LVLLVPKFISFGFRICRFLAYLMKVIPETRRAHSRLITGCVTRLTQRVPLVEQELLTLSEHLSSPPVFSGVRVTRSLVLCVCFVDGFLFFCPFSFGHCIVCSSSIYGLWLPPFGVFKPFLYIYVVIYYLLISKKNEVLSMKTIINY
jgi:hypothetical protein